MPEPLSSLERRALGVLVEKALTASAPEPLSLNAIVIGSNQKSNRDPLMAVEEPEVDSALEGLQRKRLVFRVTGGRVERWRHNLYDAWQLTKSELALMAELLLRGPQTAAEARSRASRMDPLDNEMASDLIKILVDRGFVVWLTPENRRGAVLTHGFHTPDELARLRAGHHGMASVEEPHAPIRVIAPTAPPQIDNRLTDAIAEIARLRADLEQVRAAVASLQNALGLEPGTP
jgi:uncharacterized protein